MELIYFWIKISKNNIFKNQDVSLTNEYSILFNEKSNVLKIKKNDNYYNIFKNNVITNVNAIVGYNGAGKTTILEYIYRMDSLPYVKTSDYLSKGEIEEINRNITIQIYKTNENLLIIHNIKEGISIEGISKVQVINTYDLIQEENVIKKKLNLTKIYLTNSIYNYGLNGYFIKSSQYENIALTYQSLKTFMQGFYDKINRFPRGLIKDNWFNCFQQIVIYNKNENDFQQMCDFLYFDKLLKDRKIESFTGKVATKLILKIKSLRNLLYNLSSVSQAIKRYRSSREYSKRIEYKLSKWSKQLILDENNLDFITQLEVNLILELDFIYDILQEDEIIVKNDILSIIKSTITSIEDEKEKEYYINAINEINNLQKILISNETNSIVIDFSNINKEYTELCNYISQNLQQGTTYIGKYLEILNLEMSSGERAYLNFFSWINLITFFNKLLPDRVAKNTNDNILLLIDEIDLYCHPEWQRKMINNFLLELRNQFCDKKIQVIFTTHSPIVLSDIPLSNTLYVRSNKVLSQIDDRVIHKETFSSNIYQLFNDSFFLKGKSAIGEFALNTINENICEIKKGEFSKNNIEKIQYIVDIIGEPIIKKKLTNMLRKQMNIKKYNIDQHIRLVEKNNNDKQKVLQIKKKLEDLLEEINNELE